MKKHIFPIQNPSPILHFKAMLKSPAFLLPKLCRNPMNDQTKSHEEPLKTMLENCGKTCGVHCTLRMRTQSLPNNPLTITTSASPEKQIYMQLAWAWALWPHRLREKLA